MNEMTTKVLALRKGEIHTFGYGKKIIPSAKKYGPHIIEKISRFQGRTGAYENQTAVIDARANGATQGQLKGLKEVVEDVVFMNADGQYRVRVLPLRTLSVKWLIDGQETSLEELLKTFAPSILGVRASNPDEKPEPHCLTLDPENIIEII